MLVNKFYNNLKTGLLLGLMASLILIAGVMIAGQQGLMIAIILAAVMNFVSFFFSDKIALMSAGAQEVGPETELYQIVAELAQGAGLPMPRVYISPQAAPNAFATGRGPNHAAVCATSGLLQMLNRREIAAVMGHELTHVKNRDVLTMTVTATIAAAFTYLSYMFYFGGGRRDRDDVHPLLAILLIILGPIAAALIQAAISRSREYNADTGGAELTGNPQALASALEKIHAAAGQIPLEVNPAFNHLFIAEPRGVGQSIANLFQTHPPLEKRLLNLIGREHTGQFRSAVA